MTHALISFIVAAVIVGVVLWLVYKVVPLEPPIRTVISVVCALALLLWGLRLLGIY